MQQTRSQGQPAGCESVDPIRVLVVSQHDLVRRQLVEYLGRSPMHAVGCGEVSADAIVLARPDVVVLDLSRLGPGDLLEVLGAARLVGARVIALASMRELADERTVIEAGGLYRLKSAGADGLADAVRAAAHRRPDVNLTGNAR